MGKIFDLWVLWVNLYFGFIKIFFVVVFGRFLRFFDFSYPLYLGRVLLLILFFDCLSFCFGGFFSFDGLSFVLVFLRVWIYILSVYSSIREFWFSNYYGRFLFYLGGIFFFLVLRFSCLNFILFYVSFEFIFLIMFIFLLGWGYRPERRQASFYMVFYTLLVSFPFLVFLLLGSLFFGSRCFRVFFLFDGYW